MLVTLALAAQGCTRRVHPGVVPTANQGGGLRLLTTLERVWRLPGLESTQSLLTTNPDGNILLAVKQTGEHAWDLCAIDVARGSVEWCSRLAQRADVALSVVADKAVAHTAAGDVTAYDLDNGKLAWKLALDCEVRPGHLRAVGEGLAIAECHREGSVASEPRKPDLSAIDLKDGKIRWQYAERRPHEGTYLLDGRFILDRRAAPGAHLSDGPPPRPQASIRVGDQDSDWAVLDVRTGLTLRPSSLVRKTGDDKSGGQAQVVARALFSDRAAIFDQERDGLEARPTSAEMRWSCPAATHDLWSLRRPRGWLWREGRLFAAGCSEVHEIDPATDGSHQSWPLASHETVLEPLLLAMDVAGSRVTFVIGSHDDRETGRVVSFDGRQLISVSRSPVLDPDLLALSRGILVVQEEVDLGPPGELSPSGPSRKPVLAGYSLTDVRAAPLDADRSNTERIRGLIAGLGIPDQRVCSACETLMDAKSMSTLQAIPRWETLLSALLRDGSRRTRDAAFAAVKQTHTPALLRELVRLLEPKPVAGWSPWNPESDWWILVAEKDQEVRLEAALMLIELRHLPAIKPLGKLFLEAPIGDPHEPLGGKMFPEAFCTWVRDVNLPSAKEAIEDYNRALGAPGAWQARCQDLMRPLRLRPRR